MEMTQRNTLEREAKNDFQARPITPPVDIVEDQDGITVRADLPGVSKEDLAIDVDGDTLTIAGSVNLGETAGLQSVYAEVRSPQYKRSFVLSRDLDTANVQATLANGVLTLRVPKSEQAKPRRVEIKS